MPTYFFMIIYFALWLEKQQDNRPKICDSTVQVSTKLKPTFGTPGPEVSAPAETLLLRVGGGIDVDALAEGPTVLVLFALILILAVLAVVSLVAPAPGDHVPTIATAGLTELTP